MSDYNASTPETPETPDAITPPPAQPPAMPAIHIHMPTPKKSVLRLILRVVLVVAVLAGMGAITMEMTGVLNQLQGGTSWQVPEDGDKDQCIAVYRISGALGAESVARFDRFYRRVKDNESIKAIVLRVNSPGGTVSASEQIHHLVEQLKATGKPVVVSMGGVAASGGYMVSCNADEIFAEPATVTGSIGVIATWFVVEGTLDKIGVQPITVKSNDADYWKQSVSPFHEPDVRQIAELRNMLNAMQTQFNEMVTAGRGDRLKPRTLPAPQPPMIARAMPVTRAIPLRRAFRHELDSSDGVVRAVTPEEFQAFVLNARGPGQPERIAVTNPDFTITMRVAGPNAEQCFIDLNADSTTIPTFTNVYDSSPDASGELRIVTVGPIAGELDPTSALPTVTVEELKAQLAAMTAEDRQAAVEKARTFTTTGPLPVEGMDPEKLAELRALLAEPNDPATEAERRERLQLLFGELLTDETPHHVYLAEDLAVLNQTRLYSSGNREVSAESLRGLVARAMLDDSESSPELKAQIEQIAVQLDASRPALAPKLIETEPFNGKVYIAAEALKLGMIDTIGYQDAALDRAAKLANLDDPKVIVYTEHQGIFEGFMSFQSSGPAAQIEEAIEGASTPSIMAIYRVD